MKSILKIALGIILAFILIIVGITACTSTAINEMEKETEKEKSCLVIQNSELVNEGDEYFAMKYIKGTAKNTCDDTISYVQIDAITYDADGNQIDGGLGLDNTNDLKGQGTWQFEIWVDDNTNTYDLTITNNVFE